MHAIHMAIHVHKHVGIVGVRARMCMRFVHNNVNRCYICQDCQQPTPRFGSAQQCSWRRNAFGLRVTKQCGISFTRKISLCSLSSICWTIRTSERPKSTVRCIIGSWWIWRGIGVAFYIKTYLPEIAPSSTPTLRITKTQ